MNAQDHKVIDSGERDATISGYVINRKDLKDNIQNLSKINNFKAAGSIIRQWIVITASVFIFLFTFHSLTGTLELIEGFSQLTRGQLVIILGVYLLCTLIIATRQHALGIIMHDATHYRLFANDVVSDLFCAFPLGLATSLYRYQHLAHHRYINEDRDPYWVDMMADTDWHWPKQKGEALQLFLADCAGLNVSKWGKIIRHWSPWAQLFTFRKGPGCITQQERLRFITFWLLVSVFLTLTHSWLLFILLWMVPQLTVLNAFIRLRSVAEHLALENEHELNQTRHIDGTLLERLTICPLNTNIHIAHHMFPSVPQYNLPKLHKLLMQDDSYRTQGKIFSSYLNPKTGVLSELII